MDLSLSESERRFRDALVEWATSVPKPAGLVDYGPMPTTELAPVARQWQRQLYDDGWAGISWPVEFGGRGSTQVEQAIYAEEMAHLGLPRQSNVTSLELAGPMIFSFGTSVQQERFLQPILRGDHVWAQLFSEPGAGSDLAGLSTRAVADEEGWRVTGQKIWSSGGHYADMGLLLARTGDPGHRGITCFLLPLDRPGISARPIVQLNGESKFSEIFLDDVPVTADDVLGEIDAGWSIAMSTLGRERITLGSHAVALRRRLELLARNPGVATDDTLRLPLAELWSRVNLLRLTWFRLLSDGATGSDSRSSVLKLVYSELDRQIPLLSAEALGADFVTSAPDIADQLLVSLSKTIIGGTSEIQRTILAERVLGLPRN